MQNVNKEYLIQIIKKGINGSLPRYLSDRLSERIADALVLEGLKVTGNKEDKG